MEAPLVPQPRKKRYKHILFGIIILISGIIIGFSAGVYMIKNHFYSFRPTDKRLAEHFSESVIDDYPTIVVGPETIANVLKQHYSSFHELNDEVSFRIMQIQQDIADEIATFISDPAEKQRWMCSYTRYFPGHKMREQKAKRFEKNRCPMIEPGPPPPPDNDHRDFIRQRTFDRMEHRR